MEAETVEVVAVSEVAVVVLAEAATVIYNAKILILNLGFE